MTKHRSAIMLLILLAVFFTGCAPANEVNNNDTETEAMKEDVVAAETDEKGKEGPNDSTTTDNSTVNKTEKLDGLTVYFLDVGQADATLFQFKDGDEEFIILFDVGDWRGNEVVQFLNENKFKDIDLIIISHPHADHIGQLATIMEQFSVGEVWMSGNTANTNVFEQAAEAILASDAGYDEPRAGDEYAIGPLQLTILHPTILTSGLNEDSLSARFTYGEISFVFTGDAYKQQEREMLQRELELDATFLQLGHHGSNTSSDAQFIKRVAPEHAIYSAGNNNSYGHPHKEILTLMNEMGITLYGTDVHGTIIVTTDGLSYDIQTTKEGIVQAGGGENKQTSKKETGKKQDQATSKSNTKDCIDINRASEKELMGIIHIGEARAKDLIELRPFESVEDLAQVSGIGSARMNDILEENRACVK